MESSSSRVHAPMSTATAPTHLPSNPHFSSANGEHSLADMARRDLDAALQLLADRAQYITGASGAAIALRREGKKDMLCRASTGSNAPELGALLSTEFGLSGESVRTRQPLRCDDAERDVRVNRDVCRQLGIASVVVMPVVNDDEVLGVFELFSGEVNAFGERDLSAVQRLSVMVETAVRLAQAAENLPERLRVGVISAPTEVEQDKVEQDKVLAGEVLEELVLEGPTLGEVVAEEVILEDAVLQAPEPVPQVAAKVTVENVEAATSKMPTLETPAASAISGQALSQKAIENEATAVDVTATAVPLPAIGGIAESTVVSPSVSPTVVEPQSVGADRVSTSPQADVLPVPSVGIAPSTKQLFWSAALNPAGDGARPEEADQSHIPPVLRSLCKCQACGFPVSAGRLLCVECEEKKWRGQLVPRAGAARQVATQAAVASVAAAPKAEARAFAAAAQSGAGRGSVAPVPNANPSGQTAAFPPSAHPSVHPSAQTLEVPSRDFVLSAGLQPSQSWLAANKYVIGVLLVVAVAVAAFVVLR
jgi:GAF domain-containing protein